MCGLVGVIQTTKNYTDQTKYVSFFKKALLLDIVRGQDSTGVIKVGKISGVSIRKKAINAFDFLDCKTTEDFLKVSTDDHLALLGHNRAATRGKVTNENAHPFQHGAISLTHNGTLLSARGVGNKFTVDSENICYALSECKNKKDTVDILESLDGAFALVWYDERNKTVNFARNKERPFFYQRVDNGILYASEPWIIWGACSEPFKTEITRKEKMVELPVGKWVSVYLDSGKIKEVNFSPFVYTTIKVDGKTYTQDYSSGNRSTYQGSSRETTLIHPKRKEFFEKYPLTVGDGLLFKYIKHTPIYANGSTRYSVTTRLVSQHIGFKEEVTCTWYNVDNKDIEDMTHGNVIVRGEFSSLWSDKYTGELLMYCTNMMPLYTNKELLDNNVIAPADDTIKSLLIHAEEDGEGTSDNSDTVPASDKGLFYNWNGEEISREAFQYYCNLGCSLCGDPLDMDSDDLVWRGENIFHCDCEECYEESINLDINNDTINSVDTGNFESYD